MLEKPKRSWQAFSPVPKTTSSMFSCPPDLVKKVEKREERERRRERTRGRERRGRETDRTDKGESRGEMGRGAVGESCREKQLGVKPRPCFLGNRVNRPSSSFHPSTPLGVNS